MSTKNITASLKLYNVRLSFPNLFTPSAIPHIDSKAKYSVKLIVDKKDVENVAKIKTALATVKQNWTVAPKGLQNFAVVDGDLDKDGRPEYKNAWVIGAKSNDTRKPFVVDRKNNPILDPSEIVAGDYVHADVSFYATEKGGAKLCGGLNGVMLFAKGEPLGSVAHANFEDYGSVADSEEQNPEIDDII